MQIFSIRQISSPKIRWRIVFYYLRDMERRFTTYAQYLRRATGLERVQKISVDAGFTCPNRDGTISTRGCAFCRNDAFTPRYCSGTRDIRRQIDEGIAFHARRGRTAAGYIAYLQSYSNTYAPADELARIYARALSPPSVAGLIIGTRPDTIDDEKLDMIADLARHRYVAIEYGIESTCDATLEALGRGHDFAASRRAVEAAASRGIAVGGHFILGLPGEDSASILRGTADIARMPLSSIKLHRLQILRSTPLEALWLAEPQRFVSWTAEQYIDLVADIIRRLPANIAIERIISEVPPHYLANRCWHGLRSGTLWAMLDRRMRQLDAHQGDMLG